jgi:DNA replication and repair protein RecF
LYKLSHIELIQFRNYHSAAFDFTDRVVAICGKNGVGKTNLLDAIYYLCFTKSYFGKSDLISVETDYQGFTVLGDFFHDQDKRRVSLILRETKKKELWVDGDQVIPFSKHIGQFPSVCIAPDDVSLINGGSEERRRLMDTVLSQTDYEYLIDLIRYNKCLAERNRYLKSLNGIVCDEILLDSLEEQMIPAGIAIQQKRSSFLKEFVPFILKNFAFISGHVDQPEIQYTPSLPIDSYAELFKQNRKRDILMQRTSSGIHRDDFEILYKGNPFRFMASQGQTKSLLFALKLAEYGFMERFFGYSPLLLLDDLFEKLDENRLEKLIQWVCIENKGQVFLTDSHQERVSQLLNRNSVPFQLINP